MPHFNVRPKDSADAILVATTLLLSNLDFEVQSGLFVVEGGEALPVFPPGLKLKLSSKMYYVEGIYHENGQIYETEVDADDPETACAIAQYDCACDNGQFSGEYFQWVQALADPDNDAEELLCLQDDDRGIRGAY